MERELKLEGCQCAGPWEMDIEWFPKWGAIPGRTVLDRLLHQLHNLLLRHGESLVQLVDAPADAHRVHERIGPLHGGGNGGGIVAHL